MLVIASQIISKLSVLWIAAKKQRLAPTKWITNSSEELRHYRSTSNRDGWFERSLPSLSPECMRRDAYSTTGPVINGLIVHNVHNSSYPFRNSTFSYICPYLDGNIINSNKSCRFFKKTRTCLDFEWKFLLSAWYLKKCFSLSVTSIKCRSLTRKTANVLNKICK